MSAASMGNLLGGIAAKATAQAGADEKFWRSTFNVNDPRAQVGRRLGNGSPSQGRIVLSSVMETAREWLHKVNKDARMAYQAAKAAFEQNPVPGAIAPEKPRKLHHNLLGTLAATLQFYDFKAGSCEATYDMIKEAADCCRRTAVDHLSMLRELGWIDWVRRCEATGNSDGQKVKAAPNLYFFEISRLPLAAQILLRQILKRRGVVLDEHPERKGSGPVPNKIERLRERVVKGFARATKLVRSRKDIAAKQAEADHIRAETALMEGIPVSKWAETRHPGDLAAQEAYKARMGILSFDLESAETIPHYPLAEQG